MPTPEPSPQILTERSASFNRSEIKQSMRIKASNTDIALNGEVESMENLTCAKSLAHHIRHSSLDSHPSALHPINLNSKFDHLCSPHSPARAFAKVSIISDDQADKESSFFSASHTQRESGGEPQEELSLEPHESLLQDAQEESFSTSLSVESKSPREHPDFILWGNAAFCLSEARNLTSSNTRSGLQRHSEILSEGSIKNHVRNCEQGTNTNHLEGLLSSKDEELLSSRNQGIFPSRDEGLLSSESIEPSHHLVESVVNTVEASIAATEESAKRQSSVGSTLSVHDSSKIRDIQAHHLDEFSKENPLMSSEAQSCCLDFDAHEMEASAASDCNIPAEEMEEMENTSKEINEEGKNEQEMQKYSQEATQSGSLSSSHVDREGVLMAAEEVKIRAELEIEIEKDLEQEIKTKIYLLNKRLEELTVLKATRHPKPEQSETHMMEGLCNGKEEDHAHTVTKVTVAAPLPKSPPSSKSPKNKPTLEHSKVEKVSGRINLASGKKQLATGEKDKETHSSHANTPLTSWRKFATTSGWAPHTKDSSSELPSSDGSLKNIKISKNSIDGPSTTLKPKVQVESTSSFKQDYQSWTGIASSRKFDWIRTLRSDVVSTPHISSMKTDGEESSTFLPSSKETISGNVVRTLFNEDGLSTPRKTMSKAQRKESSLTPSAGRSVFSSSKTHGAHADMIASTPRIRSTMSSLLKDNHASRSASAKRLSQKPPSGVQASQDSMQRTPELRQAKVATATSKPTSILRASPQQASSKNSRIEKKISVGGAPASTKQISLMKNGSPMHAEKPLRSALQNGSAHNVGSRKIKTAPAKTPAKQVAPTSKSRIAPSVNSTSQVNKAARIVPSSSLAKRQISTPLKTIGALTTREKVASRH